MAGVQPILAFFNVVTPAFFWAGVALVGIPILIHILNRRRYKTVHWAAMEFLLRALRKNRRRLKFEQWLLLATRCLLLFLAALALARPFGCAEQSTIASIAGSRSGLHVFVIDNSYSMGYEADRPDARTHLEQAKRLAKQMIDRFSAGGESVAIVTAARPAQAVIAAPSYDLSAAKAAIDRIEQTASGTDLVGALNHALEIGRNETTQPRRHLYLLTDATRSAWERGADADALRQAGADLAAIYRVTHFNLGRQNQWNHAALDVWPSVSLVTSRSDATFAAKLKGFGTGPDAQLQWKLDDQPLPGGGTLKLDQGTEDQVLPSVPRIAGGLHVISANLITDDRLKVDNVRTRVFDVVTELKVLIVEGQRGINRMQGSGAFLDLALAPPAEENEQGVRTYSHVATELISDLELGNRVLKDYRAVILAGVGQIQPNVAQQLEHFVRQGGTLLLFMGEQVSGDNYNATLLPRGLLPGAMAKRVATAPDAQHGYTFEFDPRAEPHPLLREFRGRPDSGIDRAQVFAYWQIDLKPDAKVERVLNYIAPPDAPASEKDRRDPAITLHNLGDGRVLFYSTTANADWTTLPIKLAYVPLMHELLAGSITPAEAWLNRTVGESLEVPTWLRLTSAPTLLDPQKREIVIDQSTVSGAPAYRSRPLSRPGVYTLSTGTRTMPVSVNVPADEADVRTLDDAAIKKALGDIDLALESDQLPAEPVSADAGNDYGWSVMAIVLGLVAVECFMAMRFGHYRR